MLWVWNANLTSLSVSVLQTKQLLDHVQAVSNNFLESSEMVDLRSDKV